MAGALLLGLTAMAHAQPAALDPSFGDGGLVATGFVPNTWDGATDVVELPDGSLLIAGYVGFVAAAFLEDYGVVRLRPDGTLDPTFGTDGIVTTDFGGNDSPNGRIAVASDGGFFVAGWGQFPDGASDFLLARYTASGTLDASFGESGLVRTDIGGFDGANAIALQDDGKVLVVGYGAGTALDIALVRYLADGTLDASFGAGGIVRTDVAGGNDFGNAVALLADGRIVVAGQAVVAGSTDIALLRYTSSGALDTTFGTDGVTTLNLNRADVASDLVVRPDGRIVTGGYTNVGSLGGSPAAYDVAVVGFTADGALDASFGTDGVVTTDVGGTDNRGGRLVLLDDGRLVVLTDEGVAGQSDLALLRYTAAGALDTSFGTGGVARSSVSAFNESGAALIRTASGRFVVAGVAHGSAENTDRDFFAARYSIDGALDTSFGEGGVAAVSFGEGDGGSFADVAVQLDGRIVAVGETAFDATSDLVVARYLPNGALDPAFGTGGLTVTDVAGGQDALRALAVLPSGAVVAAGYAQQTASPDLLLVRYRPDGTLDPAFGTAGVVTLDVAGGADVVNALTIQPDGKIVVAGRTFVDGSTNALLARFHADGTLDATFGTGGIVSTDAGRGTRDEANSLALLSDGRIVVVGSMNTGTNTAPLTEFLLARYLPDGSLDASFGTAGRTTTRVLDFGVAYAVRVRPDGRLVVAGQSGDATSGPFVLAQYTAGGVLDTSFGQDGLVLTPIGSPADAPRELVLLPDGRAVAAGYDDTDGVSDVALVRYLLDGAPDPAFGTGGVVTTDVFGGNDLAYGLAIQPDGRLVVAGYARASDRVRFLLARYGAPASTYLVTAEVRDGNAAFAGATVTATPSGGPAVTATTDAEGRAALVVPAGAPVAVSVAAPSAAFLPDVLTLPALTADQAVTFVRTTGAASAQVTITQQATVTTAGGTLSLPAGVEISIPPGALSGSLALVVGTFVDPPLGAPPFAGPLFYFGPPGTQFAAPVTLTVPYNEADIPAGTPEEDLQIVRFDEATGTYAPVVPSTVDPAANTITAQITGFSGYAAAAALPTSVEEAPEAMALVVGPNPAAGQLSIRFSLSAAAVARLVLVDLLGREVALLVDRPVEAGSHTMVVDVGQFAPGTYVLHLAAGDFAAARRLSIVR